VEMRADAEVVQSGQCVFARLRMGTGASRQTVPRERMWAAMALRMAS
jgi:hypothetical protein